ncbi:hypothetical protein T484DRAFT_1758561 [Baffinella frigidus]|nr:hypothetical protein T484DRAFT_1758561 [Cryptophyta sp. CCMP2293]
MGEVTHPHVYVRVGPGGSGHTRFIHDLSMCRNNELFTKLNATPKKVFHGMASQFSNRIRRYNGPKMVAFDDIQPKDMCKPSYIVYWFRFFRLGPVNTWVFSVGDKGMQSCGEVTADDILRHVFPGGAFEAHSCMLYRNIKEIHHIRRDCARTLVRREET